MGKKFRLIMLSMVFAMSVLVAPRGYALDFALEEAYGSVFVVKSESAIGSAFAVGANCLVTNYHVIEGAKHLELTSYGGECFEPFLIAFDSNADIAILGVENADFTFLVPSLTYSAGDDVYAIGAPESLYFSITKGIVSATSREVRGNSYIQIDAPINPGNSGGPLVDSQGCVLGINTLKISDTDGIGFSIPMSKVLDFMRMTGIELADDGSVLGVVSAVSSQVPDYANPTQEEVDGIDPGAEEEEGDLDVIARNVLWAGAILLIAVSGCAVIRVLHKRKQSRRQREAVIEADARQRAMEARDCIIEIEEKQFEIEILE